MHEPFEQVFGVPVFLVLLSSSFTHPPPEWMGCIFNAPEPWEQHSTLGAVTGFNQWNQDLTSGTSGSGRKIGKMSRISWSISAKKLNNLCALNFRNRNFRNKIHVIISGNADCLPGKWNPVANTLPRSPPTGDQHCWMKALIKCSSRGKEGDCWV